MFGTEITPEALFERYKKLCELKNPIDESAIEEYICEHYRALGLSPKPILKVDSLVAWEAAVNAVAAWDAIAAGYTGPASDAAALVAARAGRAPWAAWAAWSVRAARAAVAARDTWSTWAARAAVAARDTWSTWAAWDATYLAPICIEAARFKEINVFKKWYPIFQAAEKGLWYYYFLDGVCIYVPQPKIKTVNGKLHSENSPAFELPKQNLYFWKGTMVPEKVIMDPRAITREEIIAEKNSEVSRAIAERLGWEEYMDRAETFLVDKWFDPRTSCHYELYDFKKRFERMPKLLKMESPEVKDGSRPSYVEAVHPQLETCQAARKWQFLKPDGTWPDVEECNRSPELEFEVET